jgi:hypothetical protein
MNISNCSTWKYGEPTPERSSLPEDPNTTQKKLSLTNVNNGHCYKQSPKGQQKYILRNFIWHHHLHVFDFVPYTRRHFEYSKWNKDFKYDDTV